MRKKKITTNIRKKDAQSEIRLLSVLYPGIKTGTASMITGRNLSLVSKIFSNLKNKSKAAKIDKNTDILNNIDDSVSILILSNFVSALKIPNILGVSINDVYRALGAKREEYEIKTCPHNHIYASKINSVDFCPICYKHRIKDDDVVIHKCEEFINDKRKDKIMEDFSLLLTNASNTITLYYKSRERSDILLRYIKTFRDVIRWLKFDCSTVGNYNIPFNAGCEILGVNPFILRKKFYAKILRKEEMLGGKVKKSKMVIFDNIDDILSFIDLYIRIYEEQGGLGKGATIPYKPLSSRVAFFKAL